jgi:chorismate dehydratase
MKLGYIDFLNCYPFYYHMFEKKPVEGVSVFPGYPGMLNKMMEKRDLDMSPISSATYADIQDDVLILPAFCLSSIGYVGSVTLSGKVPIEDLDGKKVGVTSASHTSAVLLKILLKKYYNASPVYITTGPRPKLMDVDAALLIGNDAMVRSPEPAPYSYDLGDLWLRKTGFPVVFAVFVVRKEAVEKYRAKIKAVVSSYRLSLQCLENDKARVIAGAKNRYPDIIYDVNSYYKLLQFEFSEALKKALIYYYSAGSELGLLKQVKELHWLN